MVRMRIWRQAGGQASRKSIDSTSPAVAPRLRASLRASFQMGYRLGLMSRSCMYVAGERGYWPSPDRNCRKWHLEHMRPHFGYHLVPI